MDNRRSQPIRIVIADDHPIFRDGLRRLLEAESDLRVVGEACDGNEAVKLARQLRPDILLLDLAMPRQPGLEALREMNSGTGPNSVRVILLTAAAEKKQIVEALQLGARGVVLKDSATQLLLKSIHTVMSGEYWVGRESVSNLVQYLGLWFSLQARRPGKRSLASRQENWKLFLPSSPAILIKKLPSTSR